MIIFGGTGFLGKHLLLRLSRFRSYSGYVVSRNPDKEFLAQHVPAFSAVPLESFWSRSEEILREHGTIVYLASASVPATYQAEPWLEFSMNVDPVVHAVHRCLEFRPDVRIVFLSSGGTIYGRDHFEPIPETAVIAPISAYGLGKSAAEEAIRFLGRTRNLQYAILRVSNPIGRFQRRLDQGVVGAAFHAVTTGNALNLFDHGLQVRDYVDADDVAEAIQLAAERKEFEQVTWNVGSGKGLSVLEVVDLVQRATGREVKRNLLPPRPGDVKYAVLNTDKIWTDIGWKASDNSAAAAIKKIASAPDAQQARPLSSLRPQRDTSSRRVLSGLK